jgi:ribosomal protein S18 acetylase RimI-like enzyme
VRVEIRRIRPDEGDFLMRTRLMSLLDAPFAFTATYVDEAQQPTEAWSEQAAAAATGDRQAVFVGEGPYGWLAMAGAYTPRDASRRHVYGLWVDPTVRRQGLARALIETVVSWSRLAGASAVTLWVAESNDPALELYRSLGFEPTENTKPMPSDETLTEVLMRKALVG